MFVRTILQATVLCRLKETLESHSDYNVMVIGYSLGAGICQLAVMDMLAGEHKVCKLIG